MYCGCSAERVGELWLLVLAVMDWGLDKVSVLT